MGSDGDVMVGNADVCSQAQQRLRALQRSLGANSAGVSVDREEERSGKESRKMAWPRILAWTFSLEVDLVLTRA